MIKTRVIQFVFVVLCGTYTTLLVYQSLFQVQIDVKENSGFTSEVNSATATMKPHTTKLDDIFISVKTSAHLHQKRLTIILKTWFQLAKKQTWFFTDADDPLYKNLTDGHMINTRCPNTHARKALSCKMSVEYDTYLESDKKWWCHFDDDNYVNVPRLVEFLSDYDPREDWYFGKTSIKRPVGFQRYPQKTYVRFWFATGGAGFCLSRAIVLKMVPYAGGGKFKSTSEKNMLTDDVALGYIIEHLLGTSLTVVDLFHSHLETLKDIRNWDITNQISFSYKGNNVVKIDGFPVGEDPTRFLSIQCRLFPYYDICRRKKKS